MSRLAPPRWIEEREHGEPRVVEGMVASVTSWDVVERAQDPMDFDFSHINILSVVWRDGDALVAVSDGWFVPAGATVRLTTTGRELRRRLGVWVDCADQTTLLVNGKPRRLTPP